MEEEEQEIEIVVESADDSEDDLKDYDDFNENDAT